jgi:hypothetical protein
LNYFIHFDKASNSIVITENVTEEEYSREQSLFDHLALDVQNVEKVIKEAIGSLPPKSRFKVFYI